MTAEAGHHASRPYVSQAGDLHLNGAQLLDAAENVVAQKLSFTPAAGASNICTVTVQVQDGAGASLAGVWELSLWLSDDSGGAGLPAHTPSGTTGVGSAGTELQQKVSKKSFDVLTDNTGKYVLSITDTSKTGYYVAGVCPGTGVTLVSAQLVSGNYG